MRTPTTYARPTVRAQRGALHALFDGRCDFFFFFFFRDAFEIRAPLFATTYSRTTRRAFFVVAAGGRASFFRSRASTSRGSAMPISMNWSVPGGGCQKTLTKASNAKKCAKCKSVWYCSKECQALDWKRPNKQGHKHRCAALAAADETQGSGRPRSEKALNKPEMEDSRGLLDRLNDILQTQVLPDDAKMSKMLEGSDGPRCRSSTRRSEGTARSRSPWFPRTRWSCC